MKLVSSLLKKLLLLKSLSGSTNDVFSEFIKKFNVRFEGQFVQLDKLLDDESGISFSSDTGYESELLAGLNISKPRYGNVQMQPTSLMDSIIASEVSAPQNSASQTIKLRSKDLAKKVTNSAIDEFIPVSFAAIVSLYEDSNQETIIKFNGSYGPSAANLLGRFCHLNNGLKSYVKNHLAKEEEHSPDVIFAEVVHMPEGRPGNVIARPHLRQYEIVFMADSSLSSKFQIPVSDLFVWVEGGIVKLWSKRLEKQVIPRLSSAHNYSARSLSVYKFLCMLQSQSGRAPSFELPSSLRFSSFIPRIMLDDIILSEKTWRIPRKELEVLLSNDEVDPARLSQLKERYQMDDWVSYAQGDNVLQLNIRNPIMLNILLSETSGHIQVELKEVLAFHYKTPIKSHGDDYFANELIIPFLNPSAKSYKTFKDNPQAEILAKPVKRRFLPGSEWLSLRIYTGNSSIESILGDRLFPLIKSSKNYNKWFFIRYSDDSGWHMRIRFYGEPVTLHSKLLPRINSLLDPLVESGEIHKIEAFTYEREVERYGGPTSIPLVESMFMADSYLVASVMQKIQEFDDGIRWRVTLLMTDRLLSLFKYNREQKLTLISKLRESFGSEFNDTGFLRKQLGARYREIEPKIKDDFRSLGSREDIELSESQKFISALLSQWEEESTPYIESIVDLTKNSLQLNCSLDTLLSSLLHMHNNRMFKAYGREQEFVVHDFMRRYYFSTNKTE